MKPDFVPTRPLAEHQERLEKQAWWRRQRRHEPNHVGILERVFYGMVSLTWMAWAVIGVLSGHMFFLVSRGGPLHFFGLPALFFSLCVLAGAAACASVVVDHYDRRDNEDAYRRVRLALWWTAAGFLGCAMLVGLGEKLSLLPSTDGGVGLLSARQLRQLLHVEWLARVVQPHIESVRASFVYTTGWSFLAGAVAQQLGWLGPDRKEPVRTALVGGAVLLPVLSAFTLNLLTDAVLGRVAQDAKLMEDEIKATVAWTHSLLVGALAVWAFVALGTVVALLRWLKIVPPPR